MEAQPTGPEIDLLYRLRAFGRDGQLRLTGATERKYARMAAERGLVELSMPDNGLGEYARINHAGVSFVGKHWRAACEAHQEQCS